MEAVTKTEKIGKYTVLYLKENITGDISDELQHYLHTLINKQNIYIALHLENIKVIDSTGISALAVTLKKLQQYNGKLAIINPNKMVRDILTTLGIVKMFDIHSTLDTLGASQA